VKCEAQLTLRTIDIFAWQIDYSVPGWENLVIFACAALATATAVWYDTVSMVVRCPRLTDRLHNTVTCYIGCMFYYTLSVRCVHTFVYFTLLHECWVLWSMWSPSSQLCVSSSTLCGDLNSLSHSVNGHNVLTLCCMVCCWPHSQTTDLARPPIGLRIFARHCSGPVQKPFSPYVKDGKRAFYAKDQNFAHYWSNTPFSALLRPTLYETSLLLLFTLFFALDVEYISVSSYVKYKRAPDIINALR